ncbi:serine O-acetyltransferase [Aquitalea sp. ASV15]|uniref:serine O-acetyltransferase n=1 Tax=Aquitalea sp. ASV15 TaxID=2795104 RepID=UPI0018EC9766|nr:hypothetical protein [Aquitalea sp. ASV15]
MRDFIKIVLADLKAQAGGPSFYILLKHALISHAFHMTFFYRLGCYLKDIPFVGGAVRVLIEYFIRIVFSSDISCRSRIGQGLMIVHGHDIVIGGNVVIGEYCKILNGVTLGNKDTESIVNQQPTIGQNVVIGTGAKILGNVTVGDGVRIGANSVVLINIPDGGVAVGVPAKIIVK